MSRIALAVFLLGGLAACAGEGDFGRKPYSVLDDKLLPGLARHIAVKKGEPASTYSFTNAEKQMRNEAGALRRLRGKPFIFENTQRRIQAAGLEEREDPSQIPANYVIRLEYQKFASINARINVINSHISADNYHLRRFNSAATHAFSIDHRRKTILRQMPEAPPVEVADATDRIAENRRLAILIHDEMEARLDAYLYALRQSKLRDPDVRTQKAQRSLAGLRSNLDRLRNML